MPNPNWGSLFEDEMQRAKQYGESAHKAYKEKRYDRVQMFLRMERRHLHSALAFINNLQAQVDAQAAPQG